MKTVAVKDIEAGMVLAKPVANKAGLTICQESVELTEEHIVRFGNMDIDFVTVEGHKEMSHEEKEQFLSKLDHRFRKVHDNSAMNSLKNIVKEVFGLGEE